MVSARDIQARLQPLYDSSPAFPTEDVPSFLHAKEWIGFATMYAEAARALSGGAAQTFVLPALQLAGHSVECALKACIISAQGSYKNTHDLASLTDCALDLGYVMHEPSVVQIVHLNQNYFVSMASGTKYKARYPIERFEARREPVVSTALIYNIVKDLCAQADRRNESNNKESFVAAK